jgi:hypothetical protein
VSCPKAIIQGDIMHNSAPPDPGVVQRQLSPLEQKWAIDDHKIGELANAGGIAGSL